MTYSSSSVTQHLNPPLSRGISNHYSINNNDTNKHVSVLSNPYLLLNDLSLYCLIPTCSLMTSLFHLSGRELMESVDVIIRMFNM